MHDDKKSRHYVRTQKGFPLRAVANIHKFELFTWLVFFFWNYVFSYKLRHINLLCSNMFYIWQSGKNGFTMLGPQLIFYFASCFILEGNKRKKDSFAIERLREEMQILCGNDQRFYRSSLLPFSALRNTLFWTVVDTRVIFPIMIVKRRLKDWGQKSGSLVFSSTWFLTNCTILDNVFSLGMCFCLSHYKMKIMRFTLPLSLWGTGEISVNHGDI